MLMKLREAAGMSRADVAEAIGSDLATVALYENGRRVSDAHAAILSPLFRVRPDFIRRGDEIVPEALRRGAV